jgi:hypothetical protein
MPEFERLFRGHPAHAAQVLPPMIRDAAKALGIRDEQQVEVLGDAMVRAYTAGADASESGHRFARRPGAPPD